MQTLPVFILQAKNDFSIEPTKRVGQDREGENEEKQRFTLLFGNNGQDGRAFNIEGGNRSVAKRCSGLHQRSVLNPSSLDQFAMPTKAFFVGA